MIKLIGITGKAFSGKDTVADYIWSQDKQKRKIKSFADPIKEILISIFGFTPEQCYDQKQKHIEDSFWKITPRKFLQIVGTDMFREHFRNDVWTKLMEKELSDEHTLIIPDIRFQDELEWVVKHDGIVINIIRKVKSDLSVEELQHISEKPLFDEKVLHHFKDYTEPFKFSDNCYHINNNRSLGELFKQVDLILEHYK